MAEPTTPTGSDSVPDHTSLDPADPARRSVTTGYHHRDHEWSRTRSRTSRLAAAGVALLLALVVVRWLDGVRPAFDAETSQWLRGLRVVLAVVGTVAGLGALASLLHYAATGRRMELYVRSNLVAQIGAIGFAALITLGSVLWVRESWKLVREECTDCQAPGWYRWPEYLLHVAGVVAATAAVVYLIRFALTHRTWRRWQAVAFTFIIVSSAWTVSFWLLRPLV